MSPRFLRGLQELPQDSQSSTPESEESQTPTEATPPNHESLISRRRFLAGGAAAASLGLAGCAGRVPGNAAEIDAASRVDDTRLLWDYPARAVEGDTDSDGIGYAAIRFRAFDAIDPDGSVRPVLRFRLNSTVGDIAAGEAYKGYQADWFRFRVGVPRSYDNIAGLRAFVHPPQWPELRTTYGYQDGRRELVVSAPDVHSDGTITVEGRFQPSGTTLPQQLHCGFEVHASQPKPLGRSMLAADCDLFDLSTIDVPNGVTLK